MDKINVLVTGIGGGGHGEQILKALRMSKKLNLNIIGTDITEYTSGKRFVDIFYRAPLAGEPLYKDFIFNLLEKHNIRFVFHGSEPELKFLSENREELAKRGIMHPLNSKELISLCMNKFSTYEKLNNLGIDIPEYLKINKIGDFYKIDFYPVILKPNTSSGGSAHVYIAIDKEETLLLGKYMLKKGFDIIAQAYIGSHDEEYTIGVSSDSKGNILGSIAIRRYICNALSEKMKIRNNDTTYVVSSGISQGKVCHVPKLQKQAEDITKLLDSRGPLNIQCRFINGKPMIMEINPRLSGTTSIRAMAGYNEPEMLIRYYLYGERWVCNYKEMVIMRSLAEVEIS